MNKYLDIKSLPDLNNPVVSIGSFDGFHKGHKALLDKIESIAKDTEKDYVLVTFEPHPRKVIYPQVNDLELISTVEEKVFLMAQFGVTNLLIVTFTIEFSQLSADEYIEKFLIEGLKPSVLVVGYDHRFGLHRQGDIHYLNWHAKSGNYQVVEIDKMMIDDITVSSTKIRLALKEGNITKANNLLGHPYILIGHVVHGEKLGTRIGYPTANLEITNKLKLIPPDGIYAVIAHTQSGIHSAVAYIGQKPTVSATGKRSIEVHIMNHLEDLYNTEILIEFVEYIRADIQFDNLESMIGQIKNDIQKAHVILENFHSPFSNNKTHPSK
jgi:riboflavin kinase/FMN adenylyltransferase